MHSLDAHVDRRSFRQFILAIKSEVFPAVDIVCDWFIFFLSCSSNFCHAHCQTSAIEAIEKPSFQLIPTINGISCKVSVLIKSIAVKGAHKLLHHLISKSPSIIACFDELSHVLFRTTLSIKLLELGRLIPC